MQKLKRKFKTEQKNSNQRYYSPAKLNLFFRVLNKREDGFHEVAMLMQTISLFDKITYTLASNDNLVCTAPNIPLDRTNLIWKAVDLFKKKTGLSFSIRINLEKNIPIQAGLGGGSSNLATTLFALNEMFGRPATLEQLISWAGEFSSDAPFFLSSGTAYCTGRGEKIESLSPISIKKKLYLALPSFGMSTPLVYKNCRPNAVSKEDPEKILKRFRKTPRFLNDLEPSAFALEPRLLEYKRKLFEIGFSDVMMSGSGSSLFCLGEIGNPRLDEVKLIPASFVQRGDTTWYGEVHENKTF